MAIANATVDCCFDIAIFRLGKYLKDTCVIANMYNFCSFLTILIFDLFSKSVIYSFCIAGTFAKPEKRFCQDYKYTSHLCYRYVFDSVSFLSYMTHAFFCTYVKSN